MAQEVKTAYYSPTCSASLSAIGGILRVVVELNVRNADMGCERSLGADGREGSRIERRVASMGEKMEVNSLTLSRKEWPMDER